MSELEEKTPRYIFSERSEDYANWSTKYMARATMKKFVGILKGTEVLRRPMGQRRRKTKTLLRRMRRHTATYC